MTVLLHDGSLEGYFSAIFEAYRLKADDCRFCSSRRYRPQLFDQAAAVTAAPDDARRVLRGLSGRLGRRGLNIITRAFLSELEGCEDTVYRFIRKAMKAGPGFIDNLADPDALAVSQMSLKTGREYHRFLGLIRFRRLSTGEYYAEFEPDTNLLPLLGRHFASRFPDQAWMIRDRSRMSALVHIGGRLEIIDLGQSGGLPEEAVREIDSDNSDPWEEIWKTYHKSIGIRERENPGLQRNFMPKKHWKYLPEID